MFVIVDIQIIFRTQYVPALMAAYIPVPYFAYRAPVVLLIIAIQPNVKTKNNRLAAISFFH
jgi:hypothetical protein